MVALLAQPAGTGLFCAPSGIVREVLTVGPGVAPGLLTQVNVDLPLADYTAGGDLRPAHEKGATLLSAHAARQCAMQLCREAS